MEDKRLAIQANIDHHIDANKELIERYSGVRPSWVSAELGHNYSMIAAYTQKLEDMS